MTTHPSRSLEEQRIEFSRSRFLAMPIAGTIAWAIIGITSSFVPIGIAAWILFVCTGMIFALGLLIARFLGEDLIGKTQNEFDRLFFITVQMAGLMWLPLSWIIRHWIGTFHAFARTALCLIAWFAFPDQRFVAIPAIIVVIYLITIYVLAKRPRP